MNIIIFTMNVHNSYIEICPVSVTSFLPFWTNVAHVWGELQTTHVHKPVYQPATEMQVSVHIWMRLSTRTRHSP